MRQCAAASRSKGFVRPCKDLGAIHLFSPASGTEISYSPCNLLFAMAYSSSGIHVLGTFVIACSGQPSLNSGQKESSNSIQPLFSPMANLTGKGRQQCVLTGMSTKDHELKARSWFLYCRNGSFHSQTQQLCCLRVALHCKSHSNI